MVHTIDDVVERGMCIGCGACSVATKGAVVVTLGRAGVFEADLSGASDVDRRVASRVCPFSDDAVDGNQLEPPSMDGISEYDDRIGWFTKLYVGRRTSDDFLEGSSSGGVCTWLLKDLMDRGEIDAVIHVGGDSEIGQLFGYCISDSTEQLFARRKSIYSATTMRDVLEQVKHREQRFVLVGVPCFIRAARLLAAEDASLGLRIKYYFGLVCGHMKSQLYAESLAWQVGISPGQLEGVDFRVKSSGRAASDYDFAAWSTSSHQRVLIPTSALIGANWGHAAMQPEACNFCDDIFAETADVAFGDAWLAKFADEWRGTSLVVSRRPELDALLNEGAMAGYLDLESCTLDEAVEAQAGNFRHRRIGMDIRRADDIARGLSVPSRRSWPRGDAPSPRRERVIRRRRILSRMSLEAFQRAKVESDLGVYLEVMRQQINLYKRSEASYFTRILRKVRFLLKRLGR